MKQLKLRIVLEGPPTGVDFGLQRGRGSKYETVQVQRSGSKDLFFEFTLNVTQDKRGSTPKLGLGPYVQGPHGTKFVYIDIGTFAGQKDSCWSRRLKIPLSITSAQLKSSPNNGPQVLEAKVLGKGKDGGPNCGTLKPFAGWKVRSG